MNSSVEASANPPAQAKRNLLAECAIAVMVCGAAQYFIAQPFARALSSAREKVDAARASGAGVVAIVDAPALATGFTRVRETLDVIDQRAQTFENPSALLDEFTSTAASCGVRIDELRPLSTVELRPEGGGAPGGSATTATAPNAPSVPPAAPQVDPTTGLPIASAPMPRDLRSTCHLTISGSFSGVMEFVARLTASESFAELSSIHVAPAQAADTVVAQVQLQQFRFDTLGARRALRSSATGSTASASGGSNP